MLNIMNEIIDWSYTISYYNELSLSQQELSIRISHVELYHEELNNSSESSLLMYKFESIPLFLLFLLFCRLYEYSKQQQLSFNFWRRVLKREELLRVNECKFQQIIHHMNE